jgi:hypothetical protein
LDLISTPRPLVERAREEIARATGIQPDHVLIAATHTHTGPELAGRGRRGDDSGGRHTLVVQYSERLPGLIAESVRLAQKRLAPAQLSAAVRREEGLSFNRRYVLRDGSVGWNPGKGNPDVVRPAGPIDPDVGVLLAESLPAPGQPPVPLATFVNFAMHPDTTGGRKLSADYPGALDRLLAGSKGSEMVTVFANGACGNINHIDVRWSARQSGPTEAHRIGVVLAAAVLQAYKEARPLAPGPLRVRSETVSLPLPDVTEAEVAAAEAVLRGEAKGGDRDAFLQRVHAYKVLDVALRRGRPWDVEVQAIALGKEAAWVALPGEVFVELGLAIKKRSPFKHTFIVELANGSIGYIPDRRAYSEGNYEPISARCAAGSGELLVETAARLLTSMGED